MPRILVADDHTFMRKFVRSLIEAQHGWQVCGEASDGRQAVEQARLLEPDLIVLDVHMPVMDGFSAMREILIGTPQMIILILSIGESAHFGKIAADSGAKGYLPKSQAAGALVIAITSLLKKESYFPSGPGNL